MPVAQSTKDNTRKYTRVGSLVLKTKKNWKNRGLNLDRKQKQNEHRGKSGNGKSHQKVPS